MSRMAQRDSMSDCLLGDEYRAPVSTISNTVTLLNTVAATHNDTEDKLATARANLHATCHAETNTPTFCYLSHGNI